MLCYYSQSVSCLFVGVVVSVSFALAGALGFALFIVMIVLKSLLVPLRSKCIICPPLISKEHHEACEHPETRGYYHDIGPIRINGVFIF